MLQVESPFVPSSTPFALVAVAKTLLPISSTRRVSSHPFPTHYTYLSKHILFHVKMPPRIIDPRLVGGDWVNQDPYKLPTQEPAFNPVYTGRCLCGDIEFKISRQVPLDAKFCHCRLCQKQHGNHSTLLAHRSTINTAFADGLDRSALPVAGIFPQRGHPVHHRPDWTDVLWGHDGGGRSYIPVEDLVRAVRHADHGRARDYGIYVPHLDQFQESGRERQFPSFVSTYAP